MRDIVLIAVDHRNVNVPLLALRAGGLIEAVLPDFVPPGLEGYLP